MTNETQYKNVMREKNAKEEKTESKKASNVMCTTNYTDFYNAIRKNSETRNMTL